MSGISLTEFDREVSMNAWRTSLLNRGGLTPDDVDELQDHLESIEGGLVGELEAVEAFWIAAHRVGTPDALTREFGKIQPNTGWLLRAQWLLLGVLTYWLLVPVVSVLVYALMAALASVPELRSAAAAIRLMASSISFMVSAGLLVLVVRIWRGQPETFERWLHSHGLPGHWLLILAFALSGVIRYGSIYLMSLLLAYGQGLLSVPGMVAPLQSGAWPTIALALSYLLPALALVAVVRIQMHRNQSAAGL